MLQFLSIPTFIVAFIIGLVFSYIKTPKYKYVYMYPTPDNLKKYQWVDKAKNCYGWTKIEVHCPEQLSDAQTIPIQN